MNEIKRYDVNKANMIGLVRFDEKESGQWVKHEDHSAIVAALKEQLSSYSMSAGQVDQRKAESDAVRVALGFSADADDVAPCDLLDAIAALQEQVRALAAENKRAIDAVTVFSNVTHEITEIICDEIGQDKVAEILAAYNDIGNTPATDAALREIRAQGVEGFVEFNRKLAKDYPTAMVAKALEVTELNGEQYAARIRAGEQP